MPTRDFERFLSEAVDEALSSLGETMKQAVYNRLEESFKITKPEIPYRIEDFAGALEETLGGEAYSLETLIVNLLNEKVGKILKRDEFEGLSFAERVKRTRERLYKEFIDSMQSGMAVFHFENMTDLGSFRFVAANSAAEKTTGILTEKVLGRTLVEIYPEILNTGTSRIVTEIIRTGRARDLGDFSRHDEHIGTSLYSVAAFPLSNGYIGLVFKNVSLLKRTEEASREFEVPPKEAAAGEGQWIWEADTDGRYVFSDRSRAIERWIRREIASEPHAKYFSARGKECLQSRDIVRAREFFRKAEEAFLGLGKTDEAFENASWRLNTYFFEEKMPLQEFRDVAEKYVQRYKDYSMHEQFIENLAHFSQWKGSRQSEEQRFDDARASYSDAEEMFLTLKQNEKALFNASQRVLTYKKENKAEEYVKPAEQFLDKYREIGGNKHYKEVAAHCFSCKADESEDPNNAAVFRRNAEKLFLEIGQRQLAFENAFKLIDLCWSNVTLEDESSSKKCFEATERFFEEYNDFSEHECYKKRLFKYYLLQARTLASQLKNVLR